MVPAVAVALTAGILGPALLGRGFVLVYDMVFVPRQPLLPASLGIGSALPRAVPADAVVALVSTVLPGELVQKLVLAGALLAGALGVARLVPSGSTVIKVVAAVTYTWNAYVAERLFLGHWPVLLAYGTLPWVVLAGLRVRACSGGPPALAAGPTESCPAPGARGRAWARLVLAMVPAMLGPTGGLLAAGAACAAVGRRDVPRAAGLGLLLNAPWWVPSVLRAGAAVSDPAAVGAFAARGESWGGPVLSVLGLGGVWNAEVVPASRDSPVVPLVSAGAAALAMWGCLLLARRWGPRPARALLLLAAAGVLVAVAGSVPVLDGGLRWAVAHVPGAGLVRDGQRWAAWWALLVALGVALGVEELARRLRDPLGHGAVLVGAALLPLAMLPDLAWGGLGRLQPARYPADWASVAAIIANENAGRRDVLVLPFMTYRAFGWNGDRVLLDPAPRLLPAATVTEDALPVGDTTIRGEDPTAERARRALAAGTLPDGVGWVVVEHGTPGELPRQVTATTPRYQGEWVTLYRVDGATRAAGRSGAAPAPLVLAADAAALLAVMVALLWLLLPVSRVRAGQ